MEAHAQHTAMLRDKVAVVTGGGRGIGAATAEVLAATGVRVAVLARTSEQIDAVAHGIRARGGVCNAIFCNVADSSSVQDAFAQVVTNLGPIAILINNAGVAWPFGPTAQIDLSSWTEALAINLTGAFACIRAVLPGMLERGWGRIVNISTGAATGTGMIPANAYSVSKAGLEMLTVNLATELAGTGVLIHALRPGIVETEMQTYARTRPTELVGSAFHDRFQGWKDQNLLISPTKPAMLILRLLTEETTGEIIRIDDDRGKALLRDSGWSD